MYSLYLGLVKALNAIPINVPIATPIPMLLKTNSPKRTPIPAPKAIANPRLLDLDLLELLELLELLSWFIIRYIIPSPLSYF